MSLNYFKGQFFTVFTMSQTTHIDYQKSMLTPHPEKIEEGLVTANHLTDESFRQSFKVGGTDGNIKKISRTFTFVYTRIYGCVYVCILSLTTLITAFTVKFPNS